MAKSAAENLIIRLLRLISSNREPRGVHHLPGKPGQDVSMKEFCNQTKSTAKLVSAVVFDVRQITILLCFPNRTSSAVLFPPLKVSSTIIQKANCLSLFYGVIQPTSKSASTKPKLQHAHPLCNKTLADAMQLPNPSLTLPQHQLFPPLRPAVDTPFCSA